jgi:hypothetical protein
MRYCSNWQQHIEFVRGKMLFFLLFASPESIGAAHGVKQPAKNKNELIL